MSACLYVCLSVCLFVFSISCLGVRCGVTGCQVYRQPFSTNKPGVHRSEQARLNTWNLFRHNPFRVCLGCRAAHFFMTALLRLLNSAICVLGFGFDSTRTTASPRLYLPHSPLVSSISYSFTTGRLLAVAGWYVRTDRLGMDTGSIW